MSAALVVMAAGMGSRFGGLKQAEPVSADGRSIPDFSVYDAKKAGFDKVVFILREDMKEDFIRLVGNRIEKQIDTEYVIQDTSALPEGRKKPFGTAHAILCCREAVKTPFAVINADDYYGKDAFFDICRHLNNAGAGEYAMTAYRLENTLSENGTVSRGICEVENGFLKKITEHTKISRDMNSAFNGQVIPLAPDTPVSMNLWGFTPDIFDELAREFETFMSSADLMKDEFFIPSVVQNMITKGIASVKVFESGSKWYGITYREDMAVIKNKIGEYIKNGLYD
ncbi:MAG: sugar phosphate nucleotidyltransferase [Clostridiales bacterium]|nr:sugar phosphate nucleotidyltransferase [Clostridiales bacterium]